MKILLLSVFLAFAPAITAQTDETAGLDALYQEIDAAILHSSDYVAERQRQIAACADSLKSYTSAGVPADMEKRLQMASRLFSLYKPYRNDSALHYAELCISLADSLHRPDLVGRYRSQLAYQCSVTDMYTEALDQLWLVSRPACKSALDRAALTDYYHAWMHVCGQLGAYTQRKSMRQHYFDRQNLYRDSVLMTAEEGSEEWYHLKVDILCGRRLFQDALQLSHQWLQKALPNTHESAYAAFYRSMIYDNLKNHDMTCYWLGRSALEDIRCAVMDQASLLFLADRLANRGDLARARRYAAFAKDCNLAFSPRMRVYQVNSIVNVIEKNWQAEHHRSQLVLYIAALVILLLIIALIVTISRLRRAHRRTE